MRFLDTSRIRTRLDERMAAADGAELSIDLYLPPEPGRYPVLLNRTPADNNRAGNPGISLPPAERWKAFAAQGYIVAAADVRGRGDSDGQFVPFVDEASDGAATVAWLRKLQECDGQIGLFGSGYGAFCAWAAAVADGHVGAVVSTSPFGAVGKGLVHRDGAVRLDWLFWMHLVGGRTVQPVNVPPWPRIHRHLPLNTMDEALGRDDTAWRDWLAHPDPGDSFWAALDLAERISTLETPGLHITGWWDGQLSAAHYYHAAACRGGAPQKLMVGPWDTAAVRRPAPKVGGFDFGPRSLIGPDETLIEFFDSCLKPDKPDLGEFPAARIFVTGRNEWATCRSWPTDSKDTLTLHLGSTLGANTRRGDGILSAVPLQEGGMDVIAHNPAVPVDFQPRFASFSLEDTQASFSLDQAHITSRDEALVYTSEPLAQSITVSGCPKATLTVRTTAPDADVYLLLSDSFPAGMRDLHLSHAGTRLATLESFRPGDPTTVELELGPIAHEFMVGHRIRITVVPSLYPLYARNPQTGDYLTGADPAMAHIELHFGAHAPALLRLPLA